MRRTGSIPANQTEGSTLRTWLLAIMPNEVRNGLSCCRARGTSCGTQQGTDTNLPLQNRGETGRKELESTRSELMQVRISYDACRTERSELENVTLNLRNDLAERVSSIERLQAVLAEKAAALAEKNAVLAEKDAVLAEKDAAVRRLEAIIHQLETCRSMRITAPMRAIGRILKSE